MATPDLSGMTRADLDALATSLGLDPSTFATKDDVIAAIQALEAEQAAAAAPAEEQPPAGRPTMSEASEQYVRDHPATDWETTGEQMTSGVAVSPEPEQA